MDSPLQKCFLYKKFYIIDAQMGFACGTQVRRLGMKTPLRWWKLEKYSACKRFDELGSLASEVKVVHPIKGS